MDLHPGQIGYHPNEFNWIYSQFDRSNLTGQEILLKMGRNSWIYTLVKLGIIPMNSTGFTPNSTGQIRPGKKYCLKWVEIHGFTPWSNWVSSQ